MIADLLLFLGLVSLTAYLLVKRSALRRSGWGYQAVIAGLVWASLSALVDTLFIGYYRVFEIDALGNDAMQYLLLLGFVPGVVTVLIGVSRWLPALQRLDAEIAARKQAEDDLLVTEGLLREAIDAMSDAFVVFDADDRLVMLNERQRSLFSSIANELQPGASFEDILRVQVARGQIISAVGHEEEYIAERLALHREPKGEIIQHFDDGRVIRLNERLTRHGGTVAVRTDITDLYYARQAAEKAADAVRVLLETAPVPLAMLRGDRLLFANRQMHELLGAPIGSLDNGRSSDILADIERYGELLQRVADEGAVTGFDAAIRCRDGRELWVTINAAPVDYEDGPAIFIGLLDITVRRDAEQRIADSEARFRTIAEGVPLPLCIGRRFDGRLLYANEAFRDTLGLDRDADLSQYRMPDFFFDPATHMESYAEIVRNEQISDWAIEMKTADGRVISTRHSLRSINFGSERALLGVFMDVTQQERTAQELVEAKRAAEAANMSKSQFLAVMSHELRTPLNAILGYSEVMRDELFGPIGNARYANYAGDIHDSGQHLLSLISDVLDLSRIEAGRLELHESEFDPVEMAREAIRYFEVKAYERNTSLELHANNAGCLLFADARCLRQVLLNLLSNAVKFADENTAIRLEVALQPDGSLNFAVFNRGEGIRPADLDRVLQPFTQLANAQARREHGTGLGLSICKHLMEAHGGSFALDSELDCGTTANATFPASRVIPAMAEDTLAAG